MSPSAACPDSPAVKIRLADTADAGEISALGARVFTATFGHSVAPHELAAFLEDSYTIPAITKDLHDATKDVIVAVDSGNKILGFAYLTRDSIEPCVADVESIVELQRIYVDTSAHGKGIGRLLSLTIENMAREQGFKNIWLGVWEENANAIKRYQEWGYGWVGHHTFFLGTVGQRDEILLKKLN